MSRLHDYGPLQTYQVIWKSGHIETIQGHQVSHAGGGYDFLGGRTDQGERRMMIHGEFDGHWRLMLSAPEAEIHTVRLVTSGESIESAP